jgi:hypothetical protein
MLPTCATAGPATQIANATTITYSGMIDTILASSAGCRVNAPIDGLFRTLKAHYGKHLMTPPQDPPPGKSTAKTKSPKPLNAAPLEVTPNDKASIRQALRLAEPHSVQNL